MCAGILPALTIDEALEVTSVHSVAGLLRPGAGLLVDRPFRAPHHTISNAALVGGGSQPRPGEVSLAHHGVLFLDEMLEFSRHVLEVLRQPLEEGTVTVARAARTVVFPARFMLVGAMNPCPCGFLGDTVRVCRCTPVQISSYHDRLSGPLRDRLDLTVDVPALPPEALGSVEPGESSAAVRARVAVARARQSTRLRKLDRVRTNAELTARLMPAHAQPNPAGLRVLSKAASRLGLSARGYDRIRKVARTIADLEGRDDIGADEVAEALQFEEKFRSLTIEGGRPIVNALITSRQCHIVERDDGKASKNGSGSTQTAQGKGQQPPVSESVTLSEEVEHGGPPAFRQGRGPADIPVECRAAYRRRSQADCSPGADSARSELRPPSAEEGDALD